MPHLKITRYDFRDDYKEIIIFDGEITEEHNKRINDFFDKVTVINKKLIEKLDERLKLKIQNLNSK
jgi:hypothetical protein